MNFRNLPKHIQEGIKLLPTDDEFQHRFATDKVLDEIDAMKTNMADEYKSLQLVLGNNLKIGDRTFHPITPAMWSFLWVIDSPFVNYDKTVNDVDIDLFLYLLEKRCRKWGQCEDHFRGNRIHPTSPQNHL
jgi:aspartyl-tRNA synthetase